MRTCADGVQKAECTGDEDTAAGRACYCKTEKCNTAAQSVSTIAPLTALGLVALTAVAGRAVAY